MLRSMIYSVRSLPRHSCLPTTPHYIQRRSPRLMLAASRLSSRETRGYSATSVRAPHRSAPGGVAALMLAFLAAHELKDYYFSGRTSPKRLMNESLEIVDANEEVHRHLGSKLVARGDRVGKSSSWFTQVEHLNVKDKDGRPCVRIKYHLFGPRGYASVFAEAAEDSEKGEFNFIFVQFDDTHEVVSVVDPVDAATAWRPTGNPDSSSVPSLR